MLAYLKHHKVVSLALLAVPLAFILEFTHAPALLVFFVSLVALVPLAELLGAATKILAAKLGAQKGALINIVLGNLPELIVILLAVHNGLQSVVLGGLAGGFIVNMTFVLGGAAVLGGMRHGEQKFSLKRANTKTLLLFATLVVMMVLPLLELFSPEIKLQVHKLDIVSVGLAVVLGLMYVLYIMATLGNHNGNAETYEGETENWSDRTTWIVLLVSAVLVFFISEFLVGSVEGVTEALPVSPQFIGLILAIFANMGEFPVAMSAARENQISLSVEIAVGSAIQIIGVILPLAVLYAMIIGTPLELVFSGPQLLACLISAGYGMKILQDAQTDAEEGWIGILLFVLCGIIFFFFA